MRPGLLCPLEAFKSKCMHLFLLLPPLSFTFYLYLNNMRKASSSGKN
jgi:hypothetical protein